MVFRRSLGLAYDPKAVRDLLCEVDRAFWTLVAAVSDDGSLEDALRELDELRVLLSSRPRRGIGGYDRGEVDGFLAAVSDQVDVLGRALARCLRRDSPGASDAQLVTDKSPGGVPLAPHLCRVAVPVSDIERASEFYSRLLSTQGQRVSPGRHYFSCGGVVFACVDLRREGDDGHVHRPNAEHVTFAVPDVRRVFQIASEAGCSWIEDQVRRRPWGELSFYARDPFGNPICFVEESTALGAGARPG
ncbi:MAG: hypothetical protein KatS3mg008_1562 [Acidimicrobiales bacterium]|nr:MAG: hypothetical protein KatS3mg008_1562 [Acidimicrobiales bacterium]